jgi:hypothetical protein
VSALDEELDERLLLKCFVFEPGLDLVLLRSRPESRVRFLDLSFLSLSLSLESFESLESFSFGIVIAFQ